MIERTRRLRRTFAGLVIVAAALRLLAFFALQMWTCTTPASRCGVHHTWDDGPQYNDIAKGLLARGNFVAAPGVYEWFPKQNGRQLSAKRTPLYPLFIAGLYATFGQRVWIVFVAQALIDALTCGLLLLLAYRLTRDYWLAVLAAALYAISPVAIHYTQRLLTCTLFGALLTAALYALVCWRERPRAWLLVSIGALLGTATLVRPIGMYVPIVFAVLVALRGNTTTRQRALRAATVQAVSGLIMSVWMERNRLEFGHFKLSNVTGINLCWNAATLEREISGLDHMTPLMVNCVGYGGEWRIFVIDPFAAAQQAGQRGVSYITLHLGRYFYEHLHGMVALHEAPEPHQWRVLERAPVRESRLVHALLWLEPIMRRVVHPLVVIAAFVGLLLAFVRRELRGAALICFLVSGYFIGVTGIIGLLGDTARYLLPVLPLYCICAALALLSCARYLPGWLIRRWRRLAHS